MRYLKSFLAALCLLTVLGAPAQTNTDATTNAIAGRGANPNGITMETVIEAEKLLGLNFSKEKNDMLLQGLPQQLSTLKSIHAYGLSNSVPSAMLFNPLPVGFKFEAKRQPMKLKPPTGVKLPADLDDIAFYSVEQLGALVKSRQITSEKLTRFYLDRLKKYGPHLLCVVTLTEDLALAQAKRADAEIAAGKYRGPLHGIPYGVKDLLATKGYRTTWGSGAHTNQVIDEDATVVKRLEEAGAVLVAKLTMGELAQGDVWFGGQTRNPWNPRQGSSGSSAGPASSVSGGLLGFAIGTETQGSIVSPSTVCGVTGLRPSYGRVSRTGAMTLTASMDKLGPICRTVEDCAIVFNAIRGPDGVDQTLYDAPFNYDPGIKLKDLRIAYLMNSPGGGGGGRGGRGGGNGGAQPVLDKLQELGANLFPITLPQMPPGAENDIGLILNVEAAAAFDDLTMSGRDDFMVQQGRGAWANTFRRAQFVPAVAYINASRIRYELIQAMAKTFQDVDVLVATSGATVRVFNQTGYPCVVVPDGFSNPTTPTSICFIGKLFGEAKILAAAKAYQDATDFHLKHPDMSKVAVFDPNAAR